MEYQGVVVVKYHWRALLWNICAVVMEYLWSCCGILGVFVVEFLWALLFNIWGAVCCRISGGGWVLNISWGCCCGKSCGSFCGISGVVGVVGVEYLGTVLVEYLGRGCCGISRVGIFME